MSNYTSFTLRKPKKRKEVVTHFDDNTNSIYSTLSKKPADLKTTDIDLTAVRIFLSDGSHRTISTTPSTTCGEILDRLLDKLGLAQQKNSYRLQIKYQFGEARIATDTDKLSELNVHVWDSVDRIYLCKLSPLPVRRKRLTSLDASDMLDETENIYENCAVLAAQTAVTPVEDVDCSIGPVLVNDKLARGFAKAWNVGSEQKDQCVEPKGYKLLSPITALQQCKIEDDEDEPRPNYASYTLDRKRKKMNIKRRSPVTPSKTSPNATAFSKQTGNGVGTKEGQIGMSSKSPNHFRMPLSPDEGKRHNIDKQISPRGNEIMPTGRGANVRNLAPPVFKYAEKQQAFKRYGSEGNLISASGANDVEKMWSSTIDLRDSGYLEHSNVGSQCSLQSAKSCTIGTTVVMLRNQRRRSSSLDNIPRELKMSKEVSTSVPSLAMHSLRTSPSRDGEGDDDKPNLNAACLKSYKSMELLTGEDVEEIQSSLMTKCSHTMTSCDLANFPDVPKRVSSHLENCTVSDEYLLHQGKRLSQILNLCRPLKKQEKSHFRTLMNKIAGTFQLKKNKSVCSLPQTPEPQCNLPSPSFPPGPPPPVAPRPEITSPSRSSYIPVESISVPNSPSGSVAQLGRSTLSPSSLRTSSSGASSHEQPDYLQVLLPTSPSPKTKTPSYENNDLDANLDNYYQVPPTPIQASRSSSYENNDLERNPECYYQVPPSPSQVTHPPSYKNNDLADNPQCIYQVPPSPKAVNSKDSDKAMPETSIYENKSIEKGPKNEIMFNSSQLHIYSTPKSTSAVGETTPTSREKEQAQLAAGSGVKRVLTYENNEIQPSTNDGITIGGEELHVYQVPPIRVTSDPAVESSVPTAPPPPPVLPPKPTQKNVVGAAPPIPPKPADKKNDGGPPLLPPKPSPPKSSQITPSTTSINKQSQDNETRSPARARALTEPKTSLTGVARKSLRKPSNNSTSAVYYEDVADWLATMKDDEYSKLNWGLPTQQNFATTMPQHLKQNKDPTLQVKSGKKKQNFSVSSNIDKQYSSDPLCSTVSEPDLRESELYACIPETDQSEEDDMYIAMAAVGPIFRHSSMEDLRQPKFNSKGQRAPKCPPKPHMKKKKLPPLPSEFKRSITWTMQSTNLNVHDGNVSNKIATFLAREQQSSKPPPVTKDSPTPRQSSPPKKSTTLSQLPVSLSTNPHPMRPNKLPILPPTIAHKKSLNSTPTSVPFITPHLTPPPQFAASPSQSFSKLNKKGPLPPTPTPPPPPPLSTIPGASSATPLATPCLTPPPSFAAGASKLNKKGPLPPTPTPPPPPPLSTIPGASSATPLTTPCLTPPPSFAAGASKPVKKVPLLPSPTPPPPPPLSTIPGASSATPLATPCLTPPPSFAADASKLIKKGPLPPTPPPPPPPPLSTIPGASSATPLTTPCLTPPPSFAAGASKPVKKVPLLPSPTPPPPPPLSTIPGASSVTPLTTPCLTPPPSFSAGTSKLIKKGPLPPTPTPPPPPPLSTIPGASSATPLTTPSFPPTPSSGMNSPPPPPPPPISTIPKSAPDSLHDKKVPPPPPPPPPPPGPPKAPPFPPPSGLKSLKPSSTTTKLGGAKTSRPVKRQECGKSPSEMLSAELFERIKGLAKRLDNEATEAETDYENMAH